VVQPRSEPREAINVRGRSFITAANVFFFVGENEIYIITSIRIRGYIVARSNRSAFTANAVLVRTRRGVRCFFEPLNGIVSNSRLVTDPHRGTNGPAARMSATK